MKLKPKMYVYEDFSKDKEIFDFANYSAKSKYYADSNKLFVSKMEDETGVVGIRETVGLKLECIRVCLMIVVNIKKQRV